jgi:hypothetical protein
LSLLASLPFFYPQALEQAQATDEVAALASSTMLNSERIRDEFGSYGIDVLDQNDQVRVSNLYSLDGGKKITRTLAVVMYPLEIPPVILAEHEVIEQGGSMGEVFKRNGWQVQKESIYLGEIPASADYDEIYALMGDIQPANLAVHLYELTVSSRSCFSYATICCPPPRLPASGRLEGILRCPVMHRP